MKAFMSDIQPFRMCGNLYFVGSTKVSVHIIETSEGLVMIDTGYPDMYEQILDSMEYLGFDPKDICAIFHSHGHLDHFGCTIKLKELSGAKTYISRIDNEIVNGTLDLSWAEECGFPDYDPFDCDVLIEDGDVFEFGNTKIRCVLAPGHTEGVLAFFVNIEENGKEYIAAMHGGIGLNSMTNKFLDEKGLSYERRDIFLKGLHTLTEEKVDVVMGNHPQQTQTVEKLNAVLEGKSIINPDEWKAFLLRLAGLSEKKFIEMDEEAGRK